MSAGIVDLVPFGAELLAVPDQGLHLDQVDQADEVGLGADRQLDRAGVGAQHLDDRVVRHVEIGADAVHLVDEDDARDVVLVRLAPDGLGLRLDALHAVEADDRAVEDAQRALDLGREVDVAGGVDDVDRVTRLPACFHLQKVAAAVIVMPRSRSCGIQSVVVAPSCTSPILWMRPV